MVSYHIISHDDHFIGKIQEGSNMACITCPWCSTHYQVFQRNCDQWGGALPLPDPGS